MRYSLPYVATLFHESLQDAASGALEKLLVKDRDRMAHEATLLYMQQREAAEEAAIADYHRGVVVESVQRRRWMRLSDASREWAVAFANFIVLDGLALPEASQQATEHLADAYSRYRRSPLLQTASAWLTPHPLRHDVLISPAAVLLDDKGYDLHSVASGMHRSCPASGKIIGSSFWGDR